MLTYARHLRLRGKDVRRRLMRRVVGARLTRDADACAPYTTMCRDYAPHARHERVRTMR